MTETAAPPFRGQLPLQLDLDQVEVAPQLSMWQRLDVAADLLRGGEFDRDAKCTRTRFAANSDVGIKRGGSGKWSAVGMIKCGVWQTCPACGPWKCRDVASKLAVCINRHLENDSGLEDPDVWMLSTTIPHYADVSTIDVVDQLYAASHSFFRSLEWKKFAKRWGVVGRVRVLDATHGSAAGSHPHFHIALFPTKAGLPTEHVHTLELADSKAKRIDWTIDDGGGEWQESGVRLRPTKLVEDLATFGVWRSLRGCSERVRARYLDEIRGSLVTAWERAVLASGARIEHLDAFRRNSLVLSPSEKASAYFTKWGLSAEVGASTSKDNNHLRLLDAVAANVKGAAYTFKLWRRAVDGHTLVTGLGDLCARLGVVDDDASAYLDEMERRREAELERAGTPVVKVPELRLVVRAHVYAAAMRLGWESVFAFCDKIDAAGSMDVQAELDGFLWRHLDLATTRDTS